MSKASDAELIALAHKRHDDQVVEIIHAANGDKDTAIIVLGVVALALSEEGDAITAAGKRGHQGISAEWRSAAMRVRGLIERVKKKDWQPVPDEPEPTGGENAPEAVRMQGIAWPLGDPTPSAVIHMVAPGDMVSLGISSTGEAAAFIKDTLDGVLNPQPTTMPSIEGGGLTVPALNIGETVTPTTNPFTAPADQSVTIITAGHPDHPETGGVVTVHALDNPFTSPNGGAAVRRLTWAEIGAGASLEPRQEGSVSQLDSLSGCGMKYLLGRMSRRGMAEPERPGWALVGGTAYHAALNEIETMAADGKQTTGLDAERLWGHHFEATIKEVEAAHPSAAQGAWHASKGGKENYDWWRVQGVPMVQHWLDLMTPERRAKTRVAKLPVDGVPTLALELPYTMHLRNGLVTTGFIDMVSIDLETYTLAVTDFKSGAGQPKDTIQLGEYGHALVGVFGVNPAQTPIVGAYWMARDGAFTPEIKPLERHPLDELETRHAMGHAAKTGRVFMPNLSNYCTSCGFVRQCPARG